ncbi:heme-binding protein [uncultured Ruegeria sp.]|uniref:GlcG/HbpS family heme-binding protein n=1 Tax=uncultured Ruegeria sp. TaxID=259304 RepID=UPI0026382DD8|nr:heme-binding protein [uncultured Ruegeria sp.]
MANAETRDILTYEQAAAGVDACISMATENGWNVSIVVVDRGDNAIASARMTEALSASYAGANLKASSALAWGMPTQNIEGFVADKPEFRAFPGLLTIAGGAPATSEAGTIIGGIGVAGNSPDNDAACAMAAANAVGS